MQSAQLFSHDADFLIAKDQHTAEPGLVCRADLKQEWFVLSDSSAASLRGAKARLPSKTATTKFKSTGIIHATATLNDFKSTARQLKPTGTTQSQSVQWQC